MRVIAFFAPSAKVPERVSVYIGKLMIGLALSMLAWIALPVAHGGRNPTVAGDKRK